MFVMKFFLKLKTYQNGNGHAVHYFVPDVEKTIHVNVNDYSVNFQSNRTEHSFSVDRKGQYLGEFFNDIAPRQTVQLEDGEWGFVFSLLPMWRGKGAVKRYLKSQPDTTIRDMKDFYLFVGNRKAYRRCDVSLAKDSVEPDKKTDSETPPEQNKSEGNE